jgi:pyridoxine 4-dehydrogenase
LEGTPPSTLIDTAEKYLKGNAEVVVREAVQQAGLVFGESVFCATKFAPGPFRTDSASVVKACLESAQRLGVDRIDLYQIHYADKLQTCVQLGLAKEKDDIYWDGLAECYHQGLAANVGVCNYGPTMIRRAHEALKKRGVPLVSNQICFNLMRYGIASETKTVCDSLGIQVLAYSPLGKGVLSGKYDAKDDQTMPKARGKYYRFVRCLKETESLTGVLGRLSKVHERPWPQIAYSWAICKGTIPIAGAKNADQVADIAGAMDGWSLTPDEVSELDAVACEAVSPYPEFKLL